MRVKLQFLLPVIIVSATFYGGFWMTHSARLDNSTEIGGGEAAQLPPIYFYDKYGKKLNLKNFRGKVVLVNLWATWCVPCVAEMPMLDRLQAMMPAEDFKVIALSVDRSSLENVVNFIKDNKLSHLDVFWDQDKQAALKWRYDIIPTSFLLDRKGNIVGRYNGIFEWDKEPLSQRIRDLLG